MTTNARKKKATVPLPVDWQGKANDLKAIADPYRLQIIALLSADDELTCNEIMYGLQRITQPTVSHHLSYLVEAGVIIREKRGVFSFFTLNEPRLEEIVNGIEEIQHA